MNYGRWRFFAVMMLVMAASLGMADEELAESEKSEARVIAVVLGEEIPDGWETRLNEVIWPRLYKNFVEEKELLATDEETEPLLEMMREMRMDNVRRNVARIATLEEELQEVDLDPGVRTRKAEELESEQRTRSLMKAYEDPDSPITKHIESTERSVARDQVTRHLDVKLLFDKYGGRVAWMKGVGRESGGSAPYDAIRQFLKDQEEAGAFEIRDEEARRHFWSQYPEQPPGPENLIKEGEAAKEEINKRLWVEGREDWRKVFGDPQ